MKTKLLVGLDFAAPIPLHTDYSSGKFEGFEVDLMKKISGNFPHEQPDDPNDLCLDVHPDNHNEILQLGKYGNKRHWILEFHFVDKVNNIGAFFEQLLTAE